MVIAGREVADAGNAVDVILRTDNAGYAWTGIVRFKLIAGRDSIHTCLSGSKKDGLPKNSLLPPHHGSAISPCSTRTPAVMMGPHLPGNLSGHHPGLIISLPGPILIIPREDRQDIWLGAIDIEHFTSARIHGTVLGSHEHFRWYG